jgi:hypothetical protein
MEQTRTVLTAPSGKRLEIGITGESPISGVTARARFAGGSYGRDFAVGPRGYHAGAIRDMMPTAVDSDRLVVHGREVRVALAPAGGGIATLIGDYHELLTVFGGPVPSRAVLMDLFGSLEIEDRPNGMVVRTSAATMIDAGMEQVDVVVNGRGQISVPSLNVAAALRPAHRGATTRHGEVWRWLPPDAPAKASVTDHMYIFGGPRGLAEVRLEGGSATDQELLDWLDQVDVAWLDQD